MSIRLISRRPESHGRSLRPYAFDDIDTVGAFGDEPYAIMFSNDSHERVEIRISVDGTDVMSGQPAERDPRNGVQTFLVGARGSMTLEAWPETTRGGARFVFTDTSRSVAMHTHQNALGALGYISIAVFTEGARRPAIGRPRGGHIFESYMGEGVSMSSYRESSKEMRSISGVGTGAGEYVDQHLHTVTGLQQPELLRTEQIRYMWWDDLVQELRQRGIKPPAQHPSGFTASLGAGLLADLGNTPRLGQPRPAARQPVATRDEYPRFA